MQRVVMRTEDANLFSIFIAFEHATKIVERVPERRNREVVNVEGMQFGFIPGRGTTNTLFIVRRMHGEYRGREKVMQVFYG